MKQRPNILGLPRTTSASPPVCCSAVCCWRFLTAFFYTLFISNDKFHILNSNLYHKKILNLVPIIRKG